MSWKCVSSLLAALVLVLATATAALAHIKNEETQFPDIEFSDARFDIVLLAGAGVIPETPVFEPDQPLSRLDLAAWVALAEGLAEGGETPNVEALAQAALDASEVTSLEGDATFGELATAFFKGQVQAETAGDTPTKAAAAQFVAAHLSTAVEGTTLLDRRGITLGPTGPVALVESERTADGDNAYFVTIGETRAPVYVHGRVANGPTDLLAWEGRTVRRSFTRQIGDNTFWVYLEAEPLAAASAVPPPTEEAAPAPESSPMSNGLFYGLVAAVVVLGIILFSRRRRSH